MSSSSSSSSPSSADNDHLVNNASISPITYSLKNNILTYYLVPFYALLFIIGAFGNGLVIISILRSSRLRTVTNTYLLNIAVADFLLLLSVPFLIVTILANGWIFGNILCKMYFNFIHINQYVSSLLLAALSFDRYLAVCHPVRAIEFRTRNKCALIIAGRTSAIVVPFLDDDDDDDVTFPFVVLASRLLAYFHAFPLPDMGIRDCHI
jgi:hypothetical protein